MPRHLRIHTSGLLYHLMARKNNGQAAYLERTDHASFPPALQVARRAFPFFSLCFAGKGDCGGRVFLPAPWLLIGELSTIG